MTLILDNPSSGAQTHALVIGIGYYNCLLGGRHPLADPMNLGQLTSPPVSAGVVADWLLAKFNNPEAPLGSVALLISHSSQPVYQSPGGQRHDVESATMENVVQAVNSWFSRANSNVNNLAFFYFCGHGLGRGLDTYLLAEDFGARETKLMANSVHLEGLHLGMERCRARKQCFIVDCCRNVRDRIIRISGDLGDAVIQGDVDASGHGDRAAPIFYATGQNQMAYAIPKGPSRFTHAVLRALGGLGADKPSGQWIVDSMSLARAIGLILEWENRRPGVPRQNFKVGGQGSLFNVHYPQEAPHVPVVIGCDPNSANDVAELVVENGTPIQRPRPMASDWELALQPGIPHHVSARFSPGSPGLFRDRTELLVVQPPFREVRLKVSP